VVKGSLVGKALGAYYNDDGIHLAFDDEDGYEYTYPIRGI
jgi:hypothetical protein